MFQLDKGILFDKDDGGGTAETADDEEVKDEKKQDVSFDAFIENQPDEIKQLYSDTVGGLKSALDSERKSNKEAAKALKRLEELEAEEQKRKEAEMSEIEKAQKLAEDAQKARDAALLQLTTEREKNAIISEATRMGFADPEDAYNLLDRSQIETGEDGKVSGVDETLKKLSEAKPYLLSKNTNGIGTPSTRVTQKETKAEKPKKPLFQL